MRMGLRVLACAVGALLPAVLATPARADEPQPQEGSQVDLTKDTKAASLEEPTAPPPEAPPPPPYKKTLVLDSSLGAMMPLGQFRKIAPPGPWLHTQLGYEIFRWLMPFAEAELSFTDTSNEQDPPQTRAFPIYGFGG